jgi:hypothetical protein
MSGELKGIKLTFYCFTTKKCKNKWKCNLNLVKKMRIKEKINEIKANKYIAQE